MRNFLSVCLLLCLSISLVLGAAQIVRKSLAGPPEEFSTHQVPNPKDVLNVEHSFTQYIYLERDERESKPVFRASISVPVDGNGEFFFSFASPYEAKTSLTMIDPLGKKVDLKKAEIKARLLLLSPFPNPAFLPVRSCGPFLPSVSPYLLFFIAFVAYSIRNRTFSPSFSSVWEFHSHDFSFRASPRQ